MGCGAAMERGEILRAEGGKYVVASLDRDGIVSPPIGTLGGLEVSAGDKVYCFLFHDGTGLILTKME